MLSGSEVFVFLPFDRVFIDVFPDFEIAGFAANDVFIEGIMPDGITDLPRNQRLKGTNDCLQCRAGCPHPAAAGRCGINPQQQVNVIGHDDVMINMHAGVH